MYYQSAALLAFSLVSKFFLEHLFLTCARVIGLLMELKFVPTDDTS
jgi:hypothetical protein